MKAGRPFSFLLAVLLLLEQSGFAQIAGQIAPVYFVPPAVPLNDKFRPVHLRYLNFIPGKNNLQLLLDKGDAKNLTPETVKESAQQVMDYFLIGLTLPNDSFWVNLRPDRPNAVIDPSLEKTDVGRIMLEADLNLKKDLARFTSPDTPEGREYWNKLYTKAEQLFGQGGMILPAFTRPWIVPGEIIVRQGKESVYIYKALLKVMLEQDYFKEERYAFDDARVKDLNEYSSALVRRLIIPRLTREVNTSKRYSALRQVYYSLIMSQWFKSRYKNEETPSAERPSAALKTAGLSPADTYFSRVDSGDLTGLTSRESWSKNTYFNLYKRSFEKGEYNKTDIVDSGCGRIIRQYISGGIQIGQAFITTRTTNGILTGRSFLPAGVPWAVMFDLGPDGKTVIESSGGRIGIGRNTDVVVSRDGGDVVDFSRVENLMNAVVPLAGKLDAIRENETDNKIVPGKFKITIEEQDIEVTLRINERRKPSFDYELAEVSGDGKVITLNPGAIIEPSGYYIGDRSFIDYAAFLHEIPRAIERQLKGRYSRKTVAVWVLVLENMIYSKSSVGDNAIRKSLDAAWQRLRQGDEEYFREPSVIEARLEYLFGAMSKAQSPEEKEGIINQVRKIIYDSQDERWQQGDNFWTREAALERWAAVMKAVDYPEAEKRHACCRGLFNIASEIISSFGYHSRAYLFHGFAGKYNDEEKVKERTERIKDIGGVNLFDLFLLADKAIENAKQEGRSFSLRPMLESLHMVSDFIETADSVMREGGSSDDLSRIDAAAREIKNTFEGYVDGRIANTRLSKEIEGITGSLWQGLFKTISDDSGGEAGAVFESFDAETKIRAGNLARLYYTIKGDMQIEEAQLESIRVKIKAALVKMKELKGDTAAFNRWLYAEAPWNKETYARLVKSNSSFIDFFERGISVETGYAINGEKSVIRVTIEKDFWEDTAAGMNELAQCYQSFGGNHRYMPLVHALEADSMFLRVYDGEKLIGNAVAVIGENGAFIFPVYTSLNIQQDTKPDKAERIAVRRGFAQLTVFDALAEFAACVSPIGTMPNESHNLKGYNRGVISLYESLEPYNIEKRFLPNNSFAKLEKIKHGLVTCLIEGGALISDPEQEGRLLLSPDLKNQAQIRGVLQTMGRIYPGDPGFVFAKSILTEALFEDQYYIVKNNLIKNPYYDGFTPDYFENKIKIGTRLKVDREGILTAAAMIREEFKDAVFEDPAGIDSGLVTDTRDGGGQKSGEFSRKAELHRLEQYISSGKLSNSPEDVAKALDIFERYSQEGKQIIIELCGGNTKVAREIAEKKKNISVITLDVYRTDESSSYIVWAWDFEQRKLAAQKEPLENLTVLRGDQEIFQYLPRNSVDYILLVAPESLSEILESPGIRDVLKSPGGKIVVKPWMHFSRRTRDIMDPPKKGFLAGFLFENTRGTEMFGVDIDAVSEYSTGESLYVWEKKTDDPRWENALRKAESNLKECFKGLSSGNRKAINLITEAIGIYRELLASGLGNRRELFFRLREARSTLKIVDEAALREVYLDEIKMKQTSGKSAAAIKTVEVKADDASIPFCYKGEFVRGRAENERYIGTAGVLKGRGLAVFNRTLKEGVLMQFSPDSDIVRSLDKIEESLGWDFDNGNLEVSLIGGVIPGEENVSDRDIIDMYERLEFEAGLRNWNVVLNRLPEAEAAGTFTVKPRSFALDLSTGEIVELKIGNPPDISAGFRRDNEVREVRRFLADSGVIEADVSGNNVDRGLDGGTVPVSIAEKSGGIDFRSLPVSPGSLSADFTGGQCAVVPVIPLSELDKEWERIKEMVDKGTIPSGEKLKEYILSCSQKQDIEHDIERMLACISEILRLEEDYVLAAEPGFVRFLAVLESDKPPSEMLRALSMVSFE